MGAPEFARYRDTIVERHGDRWVDPFVLAMARHHAGGDEEALRDVVEFCLHPIAVEQLDILLRNVGIRQPLLAREAVTADQWEGGRILTATMRFGEDGAVDWNRNILTLHGHTMPEAVVSGLPGRPLADALEHPYVPTGLAIHEATGFDLSVVIRFMPERIVPTGRRPG